MRGARKRTLVRVGLSLLAVLAAAVAFLTADAWTAMGTTPSGARLARVEASPHFSDGRFVNTLPMTMPELGPSISGWWNASPHVAPVGPIEVLTPDLGAPPASGLRITWLGHSSMLIEIDGRRVLTDPVFGERASPSSFIGPRRFHRVPLSVEALPPLDAVVISHDHYDHLDAGTIMTLAERVPRFLVPLGVGEHLEYWGVPSSKIEEHDWWGESQVGELRVVATPARHFSGRGVLDRDRTLWASWAIVGPAHRVFFSGDTGMHPGFVDIGERLGPFDVTMLEVGAYNPLWRDVHLGPEQAVRAHQLLGGRFMLPVHWGTFNLAFHSWVEPAERFVVAAREAGIDVAVPRPGQSVEPSDPPALARWWSTDVPWQSGDVAPVVASHLPVGLLRGLR